MKQKRIRWFFNTGDWHLSYHRLSAHMVNALRRSGADVEERHITAFHQPGWRQYLYHLDRNDIAIIAGIPGQAPVRPGRTWLFTMYESTKIPERWVDEINHRVERLIVPCAWCADVFQTGLKAEAFGYLPDEYVNVVPLGVDPEEFPYVERPERSTYTFLALADRANRKGFELAQHAFYQAFGEPDETADVRLILKLYEGSDSVLHKTHVVKDPRVTIWTESAPDMWRVYYLADAFVFPSRGEGWGLPPREAASTGLPVICSNYSGMAGDVENWGLSVSCGEVEASDGYDGMWGAPDVNEIAHHMRWCYENQSEARAMGRRASKWIHANQTWDHSAAALLRLVEAGVESRKHELKVI